MAALTNAEPSPPRARRSAMYYWYARLELAKYYETGDPRSLAQAEHVLKRQAEAEDGATPDALALLGNLLSGAHRDLEGADEAYRGALEARGQQRHPEALMGRCRLALLRHLPSLSPVPAVVAGLL